MSRLISLLFEPGLFSSSANQVAAVVGGVTAVVSGVVGVFTVIRGQSFAGHALGDISTTGGSGAFLLNVSPLWGFVVAGMVGAGAMELIGIRRPRGRDVATGIVLGAALGVSALFLYWSSTSQSSSGTTQTILFGSILTVDRALIPAFALLGAVALGLVLTLYRPLLLSSMSSDLAAARGIRVRTVGVLYLVAMAIAVSLSCMTIGAILSTALLIGPPATALRVTKRPGRAMVAAASIGVVVTWGGIVLAFDSYYWPPLHHGWPVSFFVVALVFVFYLVAGLPFWDRSRRHERVEGAAPLVSAVGPPGV